MPWHGRSNSVEKRGGVACLRSQPILTAVNLAEMFWLQSLGRTIKHNLSTRHANDALREAARQINIMDIHHQRNAG
jgi:hypothetical protein